MWSDVHTITEVHTINRRIRRATGQRRTRTERQVTQPSSFSNSEMSVVTPLPTREFDVHRLPFDETDAPVGKRCGGPADNGKRRQRPLARFTHPATVPASSTDRRKGTAAERLPPTVYEEGGLPR